MIKYIKKVLMRIDIAKTYLSGQNKQMLKKLSIENVIAM